MSDKYLADIRLADALSDQAKKYERKLNEQAQGYEISLQDQARKHADLYRKHAALCVAILAGRWDEAARLARGTGE